MFLLCLKVCYPIIKQKEQDEAHSTIRRQIMQFVSKAQLIQHLVEASF